MNSVKQCMNSAKQCVNSEPIWGYCSRAEKKKKKAENVDTAKRQETRKPNTHYIFFLRILYLFKKKNGSYIHRENKHKTSKIERRSPPGSASQLLGRPIPKEAHL